MDGDDDPKSRNVSSTCSDNFLEKLIEEVKKYPCLYALHSLQYRDVAAKERCWNEISKQSNRHSSGLKKEWKKLRDCYRQALVTRNRNDPKKKNLRPWKFEKQMEFLKPYIMPRSRHLDGSQTSSESEFDPKSVTVKQEPTSDEDSTDMTPPHTSSSKAGVALPTRLLRSQVGLIRPPPSSKPPRKRNKKEKSSTSSNDSLAGYLSTASTASETDGKPSTSQQANDTHISSTCTNEMSVEEDSSQEQKPIITTAETLNSTHLKTSFSTVDDIHENNIASVTTTAGNNTLSTVTTTPSNNTLPTVTTTHGNSISKVTTTLGNNTPPTVFTTQGNRNSTSPTVTATLENNAHSTATNILINNIVPTVTSTLGNNTLPTVAAVLGNSTLATVTTTHGNNSIPTVSTSLGNNNTLTLDVNTLGNNAKANNSFPTNTNTHGSNILPTCTLGNISRMNYSFPLNVSILGNNALPQSNSTIRSSNTAYPPTIGSFGNSTQAGSLPNSNTYNVLHELNSYVDSSGQLHNIIIPVPIGNNNVDASHTKSVSKTNNSRPPVAGNLGNNNAQKARSFSKFVDIMGNISQCQLYKLTPTSISSVGNNNIQQENSMDTSSTSSHDNKIHGNSKSTSSGDPPSPKRLIGNTNNSSTQTDITFKNKNHLQSPGSLIGNINNGRPQSIGIRDQSQSNSSLGNNNRQNNTGSITNDTSDRTLGNTSIQKSSISTQTTSATNSSQVSNLMTPYIGNDSQEHGALQLFFASMYESTKKLPVKHQNTIKKDLLESVLKAEQNHYAY